MGKYSDNITPENYINYLHKFETVDEYEEEKYAYGKPFVSWTVENDAVNYNISYDELRNIPMTFKILSDGEINWACQKSAFQPVIEYNQNGNGWISITASTTGDTGGTKIPVLAGDIVQFRGNNSSYSYQTNWSGFYKTTCEFVAFGNIMSMINSTDFSSLTSFSGSYNFYNFFYNCHGLKNASNLLLPATTLTSYCYEYMFYDCSNLTTAPELPATTLATGCYDTMFYGCSKLTTAPSVLPATTLKEGCYQNMFQGCTSLVNAPELPATTIIGSCYRLMFEGCSNLNYIKCLATDISANGTYYWVDGVASTGTFVTPSSTSWSTGTSGIPSGWTRVDV